MKKYDFGGWATRNDIRCSDGRTIRRDAFAHNDGKVVPLVWNHRHDDPLSVVGHAVLENRKDGVYAYCSLNDTVPGRQARSLVEHGDVTSLSIYANQLQQQGGDVLHGEIRELSLVLAGANPGAYIDAVMSHSADGYEIELDDEAVISMMEPLELAHSEEKEETVEEETKEDKMAEKEKTVQDVFDELTEEQKTVVYALIGQALENAGGEEDEDEGEDEDMKHNVFDGEVRDEENVLSHSEMTAIINDGKRMGSLRESALQHGITDIEYLFPEAQTVGSNIPDFIQRDQTWVRKVMSGVHHSPFSRIKSMHADITEDEARALGYIKGKLKKEEVFGLLKRSTTPQTVYKKQKLDRDDIVDITDFDVVAWLKSEMRMMLDEELARAFLFGDGRAVSSDDKIDESHIRPIAKDTDSDVYAYAVEITPATGDTAADDNAKAIIRAAIKARKDYRGSGSPSLFIGSDLLSDMLLLEDGFGHPLYKTEAELATKMRVKEIVEVPDEIIPTGLYCLIVNLNDYNVGADKGGAVSMFDDFDIDYNQQKYLIETRCSGALVKPKSAIVIRQSTFPHNYNDVTPSKYTEKE